MDDLISRKELLESIEKVSVKGNVLDDDWVYRFVQEFPSTDAVQVVRCKDCLFNDGDGPNEDDKYWCALHQSFMQYCSEAEKKKETCNNKTGNLQ